MSTGRFRSGVEHPISESQARSSASGDGIDVELRALDRDTGSCRFVYNLITAIETGHVCGGTSNIETGCQQGQ